MTVAVRFWSACAVMKLRLGFGLRSAAAVAAMLLTGLVVAHAQDEYDFGDGPVPAHRHPNGRGWVAVMRGYSIMRRYSIMRGFSVMRRLAVMRRLPVMRGLLQE